MRTLIIYESAWGNTKAVADAIASAFPDSDPPKVVSVDAAPPLRELEVDLLVVGAPTHAFGMSRPGTREEAHRRGGELSSKGMREWIEAADRSTLVTAAFDTHVRHPNLPGAASRSAAKKLRRLGCSLVLEPESFYVDDYEGPLLPGELERARSWGAELARCAASSAKR
jgi:hypothetical protein